MLALSYVFNLNCIFCSDPLFRLHVVNLLPVLSISSYRDHVVGYLSVNLVGPL